MRLAMISMRARCGSARSPRRRACGALRFGYACVRRFARSLRQRAAAAQAANFASGAARAFFWHAAIGFDCELSKVNFGERCGYSGSVRRQKSRGERGRWNPHANPARRRARQTHNDVSFVVHRARELRRVAPVRAQISFCAAARHHSSTTEHEPSRRPARCTTFIRQ